MKKQIRSLIVLSFLFGTGINAQQLAFQKTIGGSSINYAYDAHKAVVGGGYVFGGISGNPNPNSVNCFIARTDDNADTLWTLSYGGLVDSVCAGQYINDICPTADGGCIAVGGKTVCGNNTIGGNMVRVDASGNILWSKYNAVFADPYPVIQSADGNFIVGGYIKGIGAGGLDAFLSKLDANGDTIWAKNYGGALGDEWFYHILQTADGGYLAAGKTTSFGQGNQDIYLVKTDANGNLQWSKAYGTANYEVSFGHSLEATPDGGYILGGQGDNGVQSAHGMFLLKIDAVGNMAWAKYYDGRDGHGVKLAPHGGYAITGRSATGIQLVRTDSLGNILWSKVYTGGTAEKGLILEAAGDGGFVVGGQGAFGGITNLYIIKTDSLGVSGCNESNAGVTSSVAPFITTTPATLVSSGAKTISYSLRFQKGATTNSLCSNAGIDQFSNPTINIRLYPNPAINNITVTIPEEITMADIKITDLLGKIVRSANTKTEDTNLDLSNLNEGIYFITVTNNGKRISKKIIVGKN